jgi:H+-transporting ATPase
MSGEKDLENGDPKRERISFADGWDPDKDEGEYANLLRYISTYRDRRFSKAPSQASADDAADASKPKKKGFFTKIFGGGDGPGALFEVPEEWLLTDINTGLTSAQVEERRRKTGFNELATEKENMLLKFLGYFKGPILYVMELAVLLAAGLQDWIDFGVIIGILMLNAVVGWYQEKQAADVVASLKGDIAMKAFVVRDGQEQEIKAREIVPGDILILEEGQVVAAECRLICDYENKAGFEEYKQMMSDPEEHYSKNHTDSDDDEDHHTGVSHVATDQSAITGESLAVDKYMGDVCYYTTGCKRGHAYAMVTESARGSFVGNCIPRPRCQRLWSLQASHGLHWNGSPRPRRFLDPCRLDWWLLPQHQDCHTHEELRQLASLRFDFTYCRCPSRSSSCHYRYPGCRCCLSRQTEGYCSKVDCY